MPVADVCELCRDRPATWVYRWPGVARDFLVCTPGHEIAFQWPRDRFSGQLDEWFKDDPPDDRARERALWLDLFDAVHRREASWSPSAEAPPG